MKNQIKALICALVICFTFYGCQKGEDKETTLPLIPEEETTDVAPIINELILGYYSDQPMNPYMTKSSANERIGSLVYDSLIKVDEKFEAQCNIAESYINEGSKITVKIKKDLVFSDGSSITQADVIYSYESAKISDFYKNRLSNFRSVTTNADEIIFTLQNADIYAQNCLDFPIIKYSTAAADIPIGSGRYTLELDERSNYILTANENSSNNEKVSTESVKLIDISIEPNPLYLLQIGDLSYYLDSLNKPSEEKIAANTAQINANNLVYLAFNSENEILSDIHLKNAINNAIDIKGLAETAFNSCAIETFSVFNPGWSVMSNFKSQKPSQDLSYANDLLDNNEYFYSDSQKVIRYSPKGELSFDLIVCEENLPRVECAYLIRDYLSSVGIRININPMPYEEFIEALEDGEYDLYLGEIKLSSNMDLSIFFEADANANYGIGENEVIQKAYKDFTSGAIDVNTFLMVFDEQLPFLPLCYRNSLAYINRELSYTFTLGANDPFANFSSWTF